MSHNAFDPHGDPPRRFPRSGESSGWQAFDSGGQVASPSPPRSRPRNPYGTSDTGGQWTGRLMDAPPTVEAPSLWPPVSEPSAPRLGAGLRPYTEPTTQDSPTLRPGSRFREPATSENLTVGQRPPSPYREYATGESPTIAAPTARWPERDTSENYRVPSSRRPASDERRAPDRPPRGRPDRDDPTPPFGRRPGDFGPPHAADTATIDRQPPQHEPRRFGPPPHPADTVSGNRQSPPLREPATGENPGFDRQPPFQQSPPRFAPPHAADTATIDRQRVYSAPPSHQSPPRFGPPETAATSAIDRQMYREPPTAEAAAVRPGSAPPYQQSPPIDRFGPPGLAATTVVERQSRPDEARTMRPDSAPRFGYESSQRSIHVEPDTGSMTDIQLAHAPADPPWQSRRAAEEDASYISPIRVLGTVGVIGVIIAIAGIVIWGLNLYGDQF